MENTKRKPGRPREQYPIDEMKKVLYLYDKNRASKTLIEYMDVFRYSNNLFEQGDITYKFTEYFWRKGNGRRAIDQMNNVYMAEFNIKSDANDQFVNTQDVVDRYFKGKVEDKEKLLGLLTINETKLLRLIQENKNLREKLKNSEHLVQMEKEKTELWKTNSDRYEMILFTWLEASISDDVPLINLMTTGKTRHPIVSHMFETAFSENPTTGYDKFEEFRKGMKQNSRENNIVSINERKLRSILDDIDL